MAVPTKMTTKVNLNKANSLGFCHFPDSGKKTGKPNAQAPGS